MTNLNRDFNMLVEETKVKLKAYNVGLQVVPYGKRTGIKYSFKVVRGKDTRTFAWVQLKIKLDCLAVGTKEEWANKAGLVKSQYKYKPNSQFNKPGAHWIITSGNVTMIKKVAVYLARVGNTR